MTQKYFFEMERDPEKIDTLTRLVVELLPLFQAEPQSRGGGRSRTRPIDTGHLDFVKGSEHVGTYEYALKKGAYEGLLDLSGFSPQHHQTIVSEISRKFPQLKPYLNAK